MLLARLPPPDTAVGPAGRFPRLRIQAVASVDHVAGACQVRRPDGVEIPVLAPLRTDDDQVGALQGRLRGRRDLVGTVLPLGEDRTRGRVVHDHPLGRARQLHS